MTNASRFSSDQSSDSSSHYSGPHCVSAFSGHQRIAQGHISRVALQLKRTLSQSALESLLILDDESSYPMEVDFSGSEVELLARLPALPVTGGESGTGEAEAGDSGGDTRVGKRGNAALYQMLGLSAQQQQWLDTLPESPAVAIKKLIDTEMWAKAGSSLAATSAPRVKPEGATGSRGFQSAREATQRTMMALGKSLPGYDEALAALRNGDGDRFYRVIESWPRGLSAHLKKLAGKAFVEASVD